MRVALVKGTNQTSSISLPHIAAGIRLYLHLTGLAMASSSDAIAPILQPLLHAATLEFYSASFRGACNTCQGIALHVMPSHAGEMGLG